MLLATKGNREEPIEEKDVKTYLNNGYDIYEKKEGKYVLKKVAPSKKVTYAEYQKLLEENKKLKAEISKLKKKEKPEEKPEG